MAEDLKRTAHAVWHGDLRGGKGTFSADSGAFNDLPYSFATRFENSPGTNPEELIAAAHAACYSMAFANYLAKKGLQPKTIAAKATAVFSPKEAGGFRVSRMILDVEGEVPGMDQATFQREAEEADKACPVSNLLRPGVDTIEVHAKIK
jgi:lipoyl-dependent peroxiredoxin